MSFQPLTIKYAECGIIGAMLLEPKNSAQDLINVTQPRENKIYRERGSNTCPQHQAKHFIFAQFKSDRTSPTLLFSQNT